MPGRGETVTKPVTIALITGTDTGFGEKEIDCRRKTMEEK